RSSSTRRFPRCGDAAADIEQRSLARSPKATRIEMDGSSGGSWILRLNPLLLCVCFGSHDVSRIRAERTARLDKRRESDASFVLDLGSGARVVDRLAGCGTRSHRPA